MPCHCPTPETEIVERPSGGGLLSKKSNQSACYAFLASTSAAFAVAALAAPGPLLAFALPGATIGPLDETFLEIAGATMAVSAAVEYSIKVTNRVPGCTQQLSNAHKAGCILYRNSAVSQLTAHRFHTVCGSMADATWAVALPCCDSYLRMWTHVH